MEAKPRSILALLMSSVMVCMVTLLVTLPRSWIAIGFSAPVDEGVLHRLADRRNHRVLHHAAGAPPDRSHRRPDRRQALTLRVLGVFRNCVARGGDRASRNRAIARAAG
jgi:hypothetical protein